MILLVSLFWGKTLSELSADDVPALASVWENGRWASEQAEWELFFCLKLYNIQSSDCSVLIEIAHRRKYKQWLCLEYFEKLGPWHCKQLIGNRPTTYLRPLEIYAIWNRISCCSCFLHFWESILTIILNYTLWWFHSFLQHFVVINRFKSPFPRTTDNQWEFFFIPNILVK